MGQATDKIHSCCPLSEQDEYQTLFRNKETPEETRDAQRVQEIFTWTAIVEYEAPDSQHKALTVDPAKICQLLGATPCALGFIGTLPYVRGSRGCVTYFRTYLDHHFKKPVAYVSDSMTEDAAMFGGNSNMNLDLQDASALYKPETIAVPITCITGVVSDDLQAFITNAKKEGLVDNSIAVPYVHIPSFVGSHVTSWDNMSEESVKTFTADYVGQPGKQQKPNLMTGFETYFGNFRALKRMMTQTGVLYSLFPDPSEMLGTPADGHHRVYVGGINRQEIKAVSDAIDILLLQPWQLMKSKKAVQEMWNQLATEMVAPLGLAAADTLLVVVSQLTDRPITDTLALERGWLVGIMLDSYTWLYGKKSGSYGGPDFMMRLAHFLLELGCEPAMILSYNANKRWQEAMKKMLNASLYDQESGVFINYDL